MNWFKKVAKYAANPLASVPDQFKMAVGALNKIPSRGYDTQQDKLNQAYDLYAQNEKNNPYSKTYDPRLRKYQMSALNRLQGIAGSKNLDAQSQAQLNKIRQQEGRLERGSREAIMQNAAERGASSSTGNLMEQLMNQQGAAERRTNQDTNVAAMQQKRALDALYGSINTAKGVGDQDYRRAQANNLFNQYNLSGKARLLGDQGQNAVDKAQAQNQFWGGILDKGLTIGKGIATGGGSIAADAAAGSVSPTGLQANNTPNPFSNKPGLRGSWQDEDYFNYGV